MSLTSCLVAENIDSAHRKTIVGTDMLQAMKELGFEHYAKALNPYLSEYRQRSRKQIDSQALRASTSKISAASNVQQSSAAAEQ